MLRFILTTLTQCVIPLILEPPFRQPSRKMMPFVLATWVGSVMPQIFKPSSTNASHKMMRFILRMWIDSVSTLISSYLLVELYLIVENALNYRPTVFPDTAITDCYFDMFSFGILTFLLGLSLIFPGTWYLMPIYIRMILTGFTFVESYGIILLMRVDEDMAEIVEEFMDWHEIRVQEMREQRQMWLAAFTRLMRG
ncbi:MAG: hypothetical protein Q9203_002659 [Teloschistes exilis]